MNADKQLIQEFADWVKETPDDWQADYYNPTACPFSQFMQHKTGKTVFVGYSDYNVFEGVELLEIRELPQGLDYALSESRLLNKGVITKGVLLHRLEKLLS